MDFDLLVQSCAGKLDLDLRGLETCLEKRHLKETLGVRRLSNKRYGQDRLFESGRKVLNDTVVWVTKLESKLGPESLKAVG